jgi:hypothetical protein
MTGRVIDDRKRACLHFVPFFACAGYTARTQDSGAKKREDFDA